jgi:hypothetical protein
MKLEPRISYEDFIEEIMLEEERQKQAIANFYRGNRNHRQPSPMVLSFALVGLVVSVFIVLALVFGK